MEVERRRNNVRIRHTRTIVAQFSPTRIELQYLGRDRTDDQGGARVPADQVSAIPVTDFYAYNAHSDRTRREYTVHPPAMWYHWVGDLAIDAQFEVDSDTGQLVFELIEAGRHHQCIVDVATGKLTLQMNEGQFPFADEAGEEWPVVSADTSIKGPGSYHLRFASSR